MSKPIYRRETQRSRRIAKERALRWSTRSHNPHLNLALRFQAQAERIMVAIEAFEFQSSFDQFEGEFA